MMAAYPALWIVVGLVLAATGAYLWTAPRRLFTRADDPSEYRPQATELDSDHGRWLTRTYPPILVVAGLALAAWAAAGLGAETPSRDSFMNLMLVIAILFTLAALLSLVKRVGRYAWLMTLVFVLGAALNWARYFELIR